MLLLLSCTPVSQLSHLIVHLTLESCYLYLVLQLLETGLIHLTLKSVVLLSLFQQKCTHQDIFMMLDITLMDLRLQQSQHVLRHHRVPHDRFYFLTPVIVHCSHCVVIDHGKEASQHVWIT